jgi:hypothetical protein
MKIWDLKGLATLAEIGASIGAMISVVYLAIHIGSSEQLRAQAFNDTLDKLDRPLALCATTPAHRFVRGSPWRDLRRHCTMGPGTNVVWSYEEC